MYVAVPLAAFEPSLALITAGIDRSASMRVLLQVCDQFDVPLEVVSLTEQYWQRVISHCVNEIQCGRTPNPDVLCNSRVKFGAFYEHLAAQHGGAFDRIASGHYACIERAGDACAIATHAGQHPRRHSACGASQGQDSSHDDDGDVVVAPQGAGWPKCTDSLDGAVQSIDLAALQAQVHAARVASGAAASTSQRLAADLASAADTLAFSGNAAAGIQERTARPAAMHGFEASCSGQAAARSCPHVRLRMTPDTVKDQTYFLAHMTQEQLSRALFPLGHMTKQEVREAAQRLGLPTQHRKDSQGLCFLGKVKFSEFIKVRSIGCWVRVAGQSSKSCDQAHVLHRLSSSGCTSCTCIRIFSTQLSHLTHQMARAASVYQSASQ